MARKDASGDRAGATRAGGRRKAGTPAGPGPAGPAPAPEPTPAGPPRVRVRMYRHGLGDCFLLGFPRPDGGTFRVLIDCGVILGTPDARRLIGEVADDLLAEAGDEGVDVLVATHEHWDHLSGFIQAREAFDRLKVGQVWMAWTEDPDDPIAGHLRAGRAARLETLRLGLAGLRDRFGLLEDEDEELARAAEVLSFFGLDPEAGPGLDAAANSARAGTTEAALGWLRGKTARPRYWRPGDLIELPEAGGVRAYVLGPPTARRLLFKDLPTRSGRETYELARLPLAERAFFAAVLPGAAGGAGPDSDASLPFDRKFQIGEEAAAEMPFFREHYFGPDGRGGDERWRRVDADWLSGAADLALKLDGDTNNTSLALAFEMPDGRVLLFPGDAQVGNWESWHEDDAGEVRAWNVGARRVTAEALLRRTVLYKVGHHGSHNATLRQKGLEMMTDPGLAAMVPVDAWIAHEKKGWKKMPFEPLMAKLEERTRGRVLRPDRPASDLALRVADDPDRAAAIVEFLGRVTESTRTVEVDGEDGPASRRPLWVEYLA